MSGRITVLTGGVGGAKLVLGPCHAMPAREVTAIVNTGDDFVHLGLSISPDVDTLLYTLAGKADAAKGWGRDGETWSFMAALRSLGGPGWFNLGDGDAARPGWRARRLAAGETLSAVTADVAREWGIAARILPMTDARVATMLDTAAGTLAFQDYFVARQCAPVVRSVRFQGAAAAAPAAGVIEAIRDPDARAILIAPSNPLLSVDPVLAVPGVRHALAQAQAPVVAVSPLIGGASVKGPTAKLMAELGMPASGASIARHYAGVIDGPLIGERDPPADPGIAFARAHTLMHSLADRVRVAQAALALADTLR